ncbi:MAG: Hpt domain-containing protein [Lachnospiraceae bacterium]|nr:Hpt domain-containing protein [Lachnospiraceae bacterium]
MDFNEEALYNEKGLNVKEALDYLGDMDLYRSLLFDYYEDIDRKTEAIRQYVKERNAKEYTVEVHSLKSSSRMIGATELAEKAYELEKCGDSEDWDTILAKTEGVLEEYLTYKDIVSPYMLEEDD